MSAATTSLVRASACSLQLATKIWSVVFARSRSGSWLHSFWCVDAEQVEAVAEHLASRIVEPQARAVHRLDWRVAQRDDPAVVVPAVVQARDLLKVARDAVRFAHSRGVRDDARELLQRAQERRLGLVVEQLGRELRAVDSGRRGVARHVVRTRVGAARGIPMASTTASHGRSGGLTAPAPPISGE